MSISFNYYTNITELKNEYLHALQTRTIPAKYRFIGKTQADAWINICYNSDYKYYSSPYAFMESIKSDIANTINKDINIIALGSCNGSKDNVLIKEILKTKKASFATVAISKELATHTISQMSDIDINKEVYISNLTPHNLTLISDSIRENNHNTNLFTILGNTFGNHPQEFISQTLREAMNHDDYLLIGAHISPDVLDPAYIQDVIASYDNKEYNYQVMLSLAHANITEDDGHLEVEYSSDQFFPEIHVVSHYFVFEHSKVVRYQNKDVFFTKGERLRVTYSNKYKLNVLRSILSNHGFVIQQEFLNLKEGYAKMLCKKK